MFRHLIKWSRASRTVRWSTGWMGHETRRKAMLVLRRFDSKRKVNRALSGRFPALDHITNQILARPTPLSVPLVLVSQVHRSGGTLLSQLFDGHSKIAAHPHELKIGYPTVEQWPPLDPTVGAKANFHMLFETYTTGLLKRGYTKGDRDTDRHHFFLVPSIHRKLFEQFCETDPPTDSRALLDHFFAAFFNAWLNYQGDLSRKKWVSGFAPRLANNPKSVEGFFGTYPNGLLVQIVRDPKSWFPSAKHHERTGPSEQQPEDILIPWCTSAEAILRNRANFSDRVLVIRFEDLVGETEATMRWLANALEIEFEPTLLSPTFNTGEMKANSSFAVKNSGVISAPLEREAMLSDSERRTIEKNCAALYDAVLAETAIVIEVRPGER